MRLKQAFLSLGSNLGDRQKNLEQALAALEQEQIQIVSQSAIYETEPQDVASQPWFLNMVVECQSRYFPLQMLTVIERIERDLGRIRTGVAPRGPRVIDIDILLFGNAVIEGPQLTIPHPRMLQRRFVLEPLLEIAPELRHPQTKEPLSRYPAAVSRQKVRRLS
ncbi:MAG TPA: 2-amino-4-hydroxy-6-hydroxymethyldihydropteridine diphosphokinase [Bryobacteraceae bacterium]|nr:2-amino-4-hydroxy-6-hydroxymethyldihydropteridine diphosphokinase [Bryobacteraceae bacterium]